jgi:class 3 adenylate cyclase
VAFLGETRKLAAILVSDVVGYGRLAGVGEARSLSRLRGPRGDLIDPAIAAHRGRVVKRTGDGAIIEFPSVVDVVRGAIEVQTGVVESDRGPTPDACVPHGIKSRCSLRGALTGHAGANALRSGRGLSSIAAVEEGPNQNVGQTFQSAQSVRVIRRQFSRWAKFF